MARGDLERHILRSYHQGIDAETVDMTEGKRRLAAILSGDVVGYSRLMETHEGATIESLEASRDIFRSCIASHNGRVVDTAGDNVLATFASAIEAVKSR